MKKLAYPLIEWNPTFKACAAFEIYVLFVRTHLLVTMTIKRCHSDCKFPICSSRRFLHPLITDAAIICLVQVMNDKPPYESGRCLFIAAKVCQQQHGYHNLCRWLSRCCCCILVVDFIVVVCRDWVYATVWPGCRVSHSCGRGKIQYVNCVFNHTATFEYVSQGQVANEANFAKRGLQN